ESNMPSKEKTALPKTESSTPLKVGGRVRCTEDGVQGRITWANATSVKIRWDDGEQVTWRRDSLADRPIEILDPPAEAPGAVPDEPVPAPAPQASSDETPAETPAAADTDVVALQPTPVQEPATETPAAEQASATAASEPPVSEPSPMDELAQPL